MADHLVLEDGRVWQAASRVFASLLTAAAEGLRDENSSLSKWLQQRSDEPSGLMGFDVRSFEARHRTLLLEAFGRAIHSEDNNSKISKSGSGVSERLSRLKNMLEAVNRGEPPNNLNDFSQTVSFDGTMINLADN